MKTRIFAAFALGVLILNSGAFAFGDKTKKSERAKMNQLVALLPSTDGVATVDVKQFFGTALPQVLANNPDLLGKATAQIDGVRAATGIDLRQFETLAVGFSIRSTAPGKFDVDAVGIARGQVNAQAIVGAAKIAADGKAREERIGGRTVYVIDVKEKLADAVSKTNAPAGAAVKVIEKAPRQMAFAAYDGNTVVMGTVELVRATLEGKSRLGSDLTGMLARSPASVLNFAAKVPDGLRSVVPMDNDEIGKSIDSIRYVYGHFDVTAAGTGMHMTARTLQSASATSLYETLAGLQMIGKAFLGSSQGADKQVYGRMIDNAKFGVKGNEVTFDLLIPQTDLDVLIGMIK